MHIVNIDCHFVNLFHFFHVLSNRLFFTLVWGRVKFQASLGRKSKHKSNFKTGSIVCVTFEVVVQISKGILTGFLIKRNKRIVKNRTFVGAYALAQKFFLILRVMYAKIL